MSNVSEQQKTLVRRAMINTIPFRLSCLYSQLVVCPVCTRRRYEIKTDSTVLQSDCSCGTNMVFNKDTKAQRLLAELSPEYREAYKAYLSTYYVKVEEPTLPKDTLNLSQLYAYLKGKRGYGQNHALSAVQKAMGLARITLFQEASELEAYADTMKSGTDIEQSAAEYYTELAQILKNTAETLTIEV